MLVCRITNHKLHRFVNAVNSSDSVQLLSFSGVNFVTVNSMAFEGDGCSMCSKAESDLITVSKKLECSKVVLVVVAVLAVAVVEV